METNITPIEQSPDIQLPAVPVKFDPQKDIENAQKAAKALMQVTAATKPLEMNGKRYLYFEHWQTVGQFFNSTVGIEWTKELIEGEQFYGYEAKAVIYNQQGVVVGGSEAMCTVDEKNWGNKPKFQLKSMAQTRAMAKALRSRFGFIAVLAGVEATPAEEIMGDGYPHSQAPQNASYRPPQQATQSPTTMPSDKQLKLIRDLMEQKGYSVVDIIDQGFSSLEELTGGKGGTASELIDFLLQAKSKVNPNGIPIELEDEPNFADEAWK
jgi:hypothetical protein